MEEITLLPHQAAALKSNAKYTAIISGIGAGKTWTGVHWILNKSVTHKKSKGFIGANTYSQLRNSTLSAVFSELMRIGIDFSYNQSSGVLNILGKEWLCKSMENFDVLRGIEVGEIWLDECAYMKEDAFNVINGRLRDKNGSLQIFLTSTPKGFNWCYDLLHPSGERRLRDCNLIKAASGDNEFLPHGYIESLKEQYDAQLIEQELMGEFVNLTSGKAYRGFERSRHVKEFDTPKNIQIYVGMDFNVDPSTCVLSFIQDDIIHHFDEVFIRNADTYELAAELKKKAPNALIIPDSTGRNRKTSGKTDFMILQEFGFKIMDTRNPYVIDRVNNMNRLWALDRQITHPRCKKLINDFEKVVFKQGGTDLDQKTDPLLTHLSDGAGYLANRLMPMAQFTQRIYSDRR